MPDTTSRVVKKSILPKATQSNPEWGLIARGTHGHVIRVGTHSPITSEEGRGAED